MDDELKFAESMRALRNLLPQMIERYTLTAELQMARYRAYVKAGFTEQQAIDLCKTSPFQ